MAVRTGTNWGKALRLACWNADGVRGRNVELEQIISEKDVDICLPDGTHLESGRALRFANYDCHRTERPTPGGGRAILVHKGTDHYAVPVSSLRYLEATAMHLVLATRPVKLVSACLWPTRPLIESDLTECLSGGIPVIMAGDLNAKHTYCSSRLITARGSLLRVYSDRNSCLI
jgi:hypothetical protein